MSEDKKIQPKTCVLSDALTSALKFMKTGEPGDGRVTTITKSQGNRIVAITRKKK